MSDNDAHFRVVSFPNLLHQPALEHPSFERSVTRELAGLTGSATDIAGTLLASPVQLEALVACLLPGESLMARLDFSSRKSPGVSFEIVARGETRRDVAVRAETLGGLLDAALASALPVGDIRPSRRRREQPRLPHQLALIPAGVALPLGPPPMRTRPLQSGTTGGGFRGWAEAQRDIVILPAQANGPHLAGLDSVISAIKAP